MTKVIITGGSGMLGMSLVYSLGGEFDVFASYRTNHIEMKRARFIPLDITIKNEVFRVIEKINPDLVIHTAALTNVDFCEDNPEKAREVNICGTKNISEACAKSNAKMIYISTDYVFDGVKGNYSEKDDLNPINWYGKTKLEGEGEVKKLTNDYLIVRTSLYGWNIQKKLSFVEWVIVNLQKNLQINALEDQFSSLMFVNDFAEIILKLIKMNINGTYNIASCKKINKFEFAKKIAQVFSLDEDLILPITTEELFKKIGRKAKRPKDVSLNISKAREELGIDAPSIENGLWHMKRLKDNYLKTFKVI